MSQLNSVSFKLKSSLTDSISQPCSLCLSLSHVYWQHQERNIKNQETSSLKTQQTSRIKNQETQRPRENQEQESRNPPKDLERNINKPCHRHLEPSPLGFNHRRLRRCHRLFGLFFLSLWFGFCSLWVFVFIDFFFFVISSLISFE